MKKDVWSGYIKWCRIVVGFLFVLVSCYLYRQECLLLIEGGVSSRKELLVLLPGVAVDVAYRLSPWVILGEVIFVILSTIMDIRNKKRNEFEKKELKKEKKKIKKERKKYFSDGAEQGVNNTLHYLRLERESVSPKEQKVYDRILDGIERENGRLTKVE